MEKIHNRLTYALMDGMVISIEQVERGAKCGCICPSCGEPLVAKKGEKVMHHFAHQSGYECEYAYETALHLLAKEILNETKKFRIPKVMLHFESYKQPELISDAIEIEVESVDLEQRYDNVVPDVVIESKGHKLFVEIYVTHVVDSEKLKKIKKMGISTIEIDLSECDRLISKNELTDILLSDRTEKHWLFNTKEDRWRKNFRAVAEKKHIMESLGMQVADCPLCLHDRKGIVYASLIDECVYCEYCIAHKEDYVLCTCNEGISSISDFYVPKEERRYPGHEKQMKRQLAYNTGICPECGNRLVRRTGQFGRFFGCRNYPQCRFSMSTPEQEK